MTRSVIRPEIVRQSKKRAKKRKRIAYTILFSVLLLIFIGCVFLSWRQELRIQDIVIGQGFNNTENSVFVLVKKEISGRKFIIWPKDSVWWVNREEIGIAILKEFPRVNKVIIKRVDLNRLLIEGENRSLYLLWCDDKQKDKCFYTDKTGFIFASAPKISDNALFRLYSPLAVDPVGTRPLSASLFFDLTKIIDSLPDLMTASGVTALNTNHLILQPGGEITVLVTTSFKDIKNNWEIRFNLNDDIRQLSSNLGTVLQAPAFIEDFNQNQGNIDYIDLRFGNKVFYRFKQQRPVVEDILTDEPELDEV